MDTDEIIWLLKNYKTLIKDRLNVLYDMDGDDVDYFIRGWDKEYVRVSNCLNTIKTSRE